MTDEDSKLTLKGLSTYWLHRVSQTHTAAIGGVSLHHIMNHFSNQPHPEWISKQPMRGQSTRTRICCKCLIRPSRLIIPLAPIHVLSEASAGFLHILELWFPHMMEDWAHAEPYWGFLFFTVDSCPHRRANRDTSSFFERELIFAVHVWPRPSLSVSESHPTYQRLVQAVLAASQLLSQTPVA